MFYLAKGLQALGMAILLMGLLSGLQTGDTRHELVLLAVGGVLFMVGSGVEKNRKVQ